MLSKTNRLPSKTEMKKSNKISSRLFLLRFKRNFLNISRFGIVVSKDVSKKSVERNRIKRLLRRCVKENLPKIKEGIDFLIIAKREIIKESFDQIVSEFYKTLKKENLVE